MTVRSENPLNNYSSIGTIGINPGTSQAQLVEDGTSNEKILSFTNVTFALCAFQPSGAENWYISGVSSCS